MRFEFDEALLWFRLAERISLAIIFVGVSIFLLWAYRKDTASQTARLKGTAGSIAFELTKPFVAALLLLGYVYVSLANPILREKTVTVSQDGGEGTLESTERSLFFYNQRLTRTYTELALKEGRLATDGSLVLAQSILSLTLQIEALRDAGRDAEIDAILDDPDNSLAEIRLAVGAL
ncbi:hypothetical protein [Pararhodobacter zhoushanensis]|uniref:hypothetical protein n=1 Tax=Pararhodobacter zhoushanensis TaxID=2479545 RepID=UPI000F8E2536|nr:hypothetical protein [Pararhodobacter zhoushanensis]